MLIVGKTRCGKTNALMHFLRKPLIHYDKIYYYCPNEQQEKLQDLKRVMDDISEKVGYEVLEFPENILATNEYPQDNRKVVVFDDLVNAPEKVQKRIANHFTGGRHHNIFPVYVSQSYFDTPQNVRLNSSHMLLYPPSKNRRVDLITKENLVPPKSFSRLKPFEFVSVSKETGEITKNLDEKL